MSTIHVNYTFSYFSNFVMFIVEFFVNTLNCQQGIWVHTVIEHFHVVFKAHFSLAKMPLLAQNKSELDAVVDAFRKYGQMLVFGNVARKRYRAIFAFRYDGGFQFFGRLQHVKFSVEFVQTQFKLLKSVAHIVLERFVGDHKFFAVCIQFFYMF